MADSGRRSNSVGSSSHAARGRGTGPAAGLATGTRSSRRTSGERGTTCSRRKSGVRGWSRHRERTKPFRRTAISWRARSTGPDDKVGQAKLGNRAKVGACGCSEVNRVHCQTCSPGAPSSVSDDPPSLQPGASARERVAGSRRRLTETFAAVLPLACDSM